MGQNFRLRYQQKNWEYPLFLLELGLHTSLRQEVREIYTMDDAKTNDLGTFSLAVDIWSVGAVAFTIVTSRLPFSKPGQLFNYVVHQNPFPIEESMTANCAKFIVDTMAPSPRRRPTSRVALSYDWLQRQDQTTTQEYVPPNPNIELGPASPIVPEASAPVIYKNNMNLNQAFDSDS